MWSLIVKHVIFLGHVTQFHMCFCFMLTKQNNLHKKNTKCEKNSSIFCCTNTHIFRYRWTSLPPADENTFLLPEIDFAVHFRVSVERIVPVKQIKRWGELCDYLCSKYCETIPAFIIGTKIKSSFGTAYRCTTQHIYLHKRGEFCYIDIVLLCYLSWDYLTLVLILYYFKIRAELGKINPSCFQTGKLRQTLETFSFWTAWTNTHTILSLTA